MEKAPQKQKKLAAADFRFASSLGMRQEEWTRISDILGRPPAEIECRIVTDLWSSGHEEARVVTEAAPLDPKLPLRNPGMSVGFLDQGGDEIFVIASGYEHLFVYSRPAFAVQNLLAEVLEEVAVTGARPIGASLFIRVGELESSRAQRQLQKVLAEGAHFLRKAGFPLLGLQTLPHPRASESPAINATALGSLDAGRERVSFAPGASLLYLGRPLRKPPFVLEYFAVNGTASSRINYGRRTLSMADPFSTACFAESFRRAAETGLSFDACRIAHRGLSGALFNLARRNRCGLILDLEKLPKKGNLSSEELLDLRPCHGALLCAAKDSHREVIELFTRWGLECNVVGEVIEQPEIHVVTYHNPLASLPVRLLNETVAPAPEPPPAEKPKAALRFAPISHPPYLEDTWLDLLASPLLSSRRVMLQEFDRFGGEFHFTDSMPEIAATRAASGDGVILVSWACDTARLAVDARGGMLSSIATGIRQIVAAGGKPVGLFPLLNVGDPAKEKARADLNAALSALEQLSASLGVALLGERESFSAHVEAAPSLFSIALFVAGFAGDKSLLVSPSVREEGDRLLVLGETSGDLDACEYMQIIHGQEGGRVAPIDFDHERRINRFISDLHRAKLLHSAMAVGAGGIAVALARAALSGTEPFGAQIEVHRSGDSPKWRKDGLLFGEQPGRFLLSCSADAEREILERAEAAEIFIGGRGSVGGESLSITGDVECSVSVESAHKIFLSGLKHIFDEGDLRLP